MLPGVEKSVSSLGESLQDSKSRIEALANGQSEVNQKLARFTHEVESRTEAARRQVHQATGEIASRIQAQMDARLQGVQQRVARLEASRESDDTRVAELQRQLSETPPRCAPRRLRSV